jgi:hypothetical protein
MNAFPNVFELPDPDPESRQEAQLARQRNQPKESPVLDRLLEDFVSGREPQTTQWIRLASMVASQSFSCDVVIRVLRPNEKVASGTLPIDKLGVSIARKVGAKYAPARLKRLDLRMEDATVEVNGTEGPRERFSFEKSFLPASARVLVIGDHETPASTFDAICKAVASQLPNGEVKLFTLYWLEQHFRGALQDDRYFLSSESPLSVLSRQANPHHPTVSQEPLPAETEKIPKLVVVEPPPPVEMPVEVSAFPEPQLAEQPIPSRKSDEKKPVQASRSVQKKGARTPLWLVLVAIGAVVLVIGLVVVANKTGMFSAKYEGSDASVIPEPTEVPLAAPSAPPPPPVRQPVPESKPKGPQGIITVPAAGLRAGPSLDSKALRKSVRGNEHVTILKRKASSAGPDWIQIETKSGTVGWVWASVVREGRRK